MRSSLLVGAGAWVWASAIALPARAAPTLIGGHGRIEVIPTSGGRGAGLLPGEALGPGTLAVGPDSQALLQVGARTKLQLDAASRAQVSESPAAVVLEAGAVTVQGGGQVKTPDGLIAKGSGTFRVALASAGGLRVDSTQGAVSLVRGDQEASLAQGQSISLEPGEALGGAAAPAEAPAAPAEAPAAQAEAPAAQAEAPAAETPPEPVAAAKAAPAVPEPAKAKPPASKAEEKPTQKIAALAAKAAATPPAAPKPKAAEPPASKPKAKPAESGQPPTQLAMAEKPPAPPESAPKSAPAEAPAPAGPPTLKVKWPSAPVTLSYTVKGTVTAGATVTVNDVEASVRESGSFSAKIELPEGQSVVEVQATGADGQSTTSKHSVTAAAPVVEKAAPKPAAKAPTSKPAAEQPESKPKVKQEAAGWE